MLNIRMHQILWAIVALLFLTALPSMGQDSKGQTAPAVAEARPVEGGKYINRYFAFSLKVPEGWTAYGRDVSNNMLRRVEGAYVSPDPATKAKIQSSIDNTDTLLMLLKFPLGASVPFNPLLSVASEPLVKDVKTAEDVLRQIKAGRLYLKYRTEVAEDIHTERHGGADLAVMAERIYVNDLVVVQKYYMRISGGYALGFVLAYVEEKDLTTFMEVINSIEFEHP